MFCHWHSSTGSTKNLSENLQKAASLRVWRARSLLLSKRFLPHLNLLLLCIHAGGNADRDFLAWGECFRKLPWECLKTWNDCFALRRCCLDLKFNALISADNCVCLGCVWRYWDHVRTVAACHYLLQVKYCGKSFKRAFLKACWAALCFYGLWFGDVWRFRLNAFLIKVT